MRKTDLIDLLPFAIQLVYWLPYFFGYTGEQKIDILTGTMRSPVYKEYGGLIFAILQLFMWSGYAF